MRCLLTGLMLGLLAISAACGTGKKSQADQLAALDSAYQSGVFSKDEYDAKKAAIIGQTPTPAVSVAPVPVAQPAPQPTAPVAAGEEHPIGAAAPVAAQQPPPLPQPTPLPQPVPASIPQRGPVPASTKPLRPAPPPPAPVAKALPSARTEPARAEPEPAPSRGCEDADYRTRKDEGLQSRFFPMPVARVKKAALDALATLDFNIHKDGGNEVEASKKRHIGVVVGAGGEREILQFEAATQDGQNGTRVTGETKKSVVGRLAQKSWTAAVLAQTACNLR